MAGDVILINIFFLEAEISQSLQARFLHGWSRDYDVHN